MQDKLKNKISSMLKRMSIVTTHPDADWRNVFVILFIIAVVSLCWNVYFYFAVMRDITVSSQVVEAPVKTGVTAEEQIKEVIDIYEARASAHEGVIANMPPGVPDPAGTLLR